MVGMILVVGVLAVFLLFAMALMQQAGRDSRAEEEAERRQWEEMQQRERSNKP